MRRFIRGCQLGLALSIALCWTRTVGSQEPTRPDTTQKLRFGFVALHGGMFDTLKAFSQPQNLDLIYYSDEEIRAGKADFASCDIVFLQHLRAELKEQYIVALNTAKQKNPHFQALTCSREADANATTLMPNQTRNGLIVNDPQVVKYYGFNKTNLGRLLEYVAVKYGRRPGAVEPPLEDTPPLVYHPGHEPFPDVASFLKWIGDRDPSLLKRDRVLVMAHANHLIFQEPEVVNALIREFEKKGTLALCVTDPVPDFEKRQFDFAPDLVVHTCHGSETPENRLKMDVPHISALYSKAVSTENYLTHVTGMAAGEIQHQITSQELKGTVEPLFAGATPHGGGSDETILPVDERIEHIVARGLALIRLKKTPVSQKKVAVVYYDREMGKSELMRGTASGMFMNAPRSMLHVLDRLTKEGYLLQNTPKTEEALLAEMQDHGRQVGVWAQGTLDRLVKTGKATLIPEETYLSWFETKVPETKRKELIHQWGPPPGDFMVWKDHGKKFIVVPQLDFGNVILLPQPLRGEAHTATALNSQVHDKLTPPPHNYLATYFWLQEGFHANALVHFGTHGSEFLLPGKPEGLTQNDWGDMIFGALPNISLWIINNVGESTPDRRRAYATIIDHLTPPLVAAELSDDLKNIASDIQKWTTLEDGALKDTFAKTITAQARKNGIDRDLHVKAENDRPLTADEIGKVDRYLEEIANESTPVSLHILGQAPSRKLLIPYLVRCAGQKFINGLGLLAAAANNGKRPPEATVRQKAEEAVAELLDKNLSPEDALKTAGLPAQAPLPKPVAEGFELVAQLDKDFGKTGQEIDNLVAALNGRFIPPGPANSPDRNPGSVPTGRDMFVVNPEEIPTPQSWEIGMQLTKNLLDGHVAQHGHYPNRVAFSLSPFSSYRDYGVIESQIFYLMGVRPVWNSKRLVGDVEIIPAKELGRPRVDVFLSARAYYRDQLPTRMRLIDKAVRLIAALDEPDNFVRANTLRSKEELVRGGMNPERAETLSKARMFGSPPGQMGPSWYYYLAQKTGSWDTREDLMRVYLEHMQCAYTENCWGEDAPEAYKQNIQGTEVVIRSWADSVSSPLSNKYMWWVDGSLALAVKQLTGKEPEFFLADVRDPGKTRMTRSEDALAADFHVRLFNRKWIEGMMKEGYAGADQMAVHVSNAFGWEVMREGSVPPETWNEIVNVYVRDSKNLHIREWFEATGPYAFQDVTKTLLETVRKGYWKPDDQTVMELAKTYAESVARHGVNRGGNAKLHAFVEKTLRDAGRKDLNDLADAFDSKIKEALTVVDAAPAAAPAASSPSPASAAPASQAEAPTQTTPAAAKQPTASPQPVAGKKLESVPAPPPRAKIAGLALSVFVLVLLAYGFLRRKGAVK